MYEFIEHPRQYIEFRLLLWNKNFMGSFPSFWVWMKRNFPFDFRNVPRSKEFILKIKLCKSHVWYKFSMILSIQCGRGVWPPNWKQTSITWGITGSCINLSLHCLHKTVPWCHLGSVAGITSSHWPSKFPQNHFPAIVQRNKILAV